MVKALPKSEVEKCAFCKKVKAIHCYITGKKLPVCVDCWFGGRRHIGTSDLEWDRDGITKPTVQEIVERNFPSR